MVSINEILPCACPSSNLCSQVLVLEMTILAIED